MGSPYLFILCRHFKSTNARIVDPLEKDELESNVDSYLLNFSTGLDLEGKERGCLVVLNSHLLSEARKQFIVSRCAAVHVKLILVVDQYNPEDKIVKVVSTNQGSRSVEVFIKKIRSSPSPSPPPSFSPPPQSSYPRVKYYGLSQGRKIYYYRLKVFKINIS